MGTQCFYTLGYGRVGKSPVLMLKRWWVLSMSCVDGHSEEFGLYFMGIEQVAANAVHKILEHIYGISKAK